MKIRVWHKQFKKYLPSEEWFVDFNGGLYFEHIMDGELLKAAKDLYTIQRFVGMYDKYKTPIYEGDIIKYVHPIVGDVRTDVVLFISGCFIPDIWRTSVDGCEIIGNIYETKNI